MDVHRRYASPTCDAPCRFEFKRRGTRCMAGARRSLADHGRRGANIGAALEDIARLRGSPDGESADAYDRAYCCLFDGLACGFTALEDPRCAGMLGPVVAGATMAHGARVPGTSYELDPVTAAFNIGAMVRWLDRNATADSPSIGVIRPILSAQSSPSAIMRRAPRTMRANRRSSLRFAALTGQGPGNAATGSLA